MVRPYSPDLRERVIGAVDEGATRREAAERFGVSVASAVRWYQFWRTDGTIAAKLCGGSRSPLEDYSEEILALIEEQSDRYCQVNSACNLTAKLEQIDSRGYGRAGSQNSTQSHLT